MDFLCKAAGGYGITLKLTADKARGRYKNVAAHPLPLRGTSFVGRDIELTELATLLSRPKVSLLTLLGPAGVGKTRLALQLAYGQLRLGTFQDAVWFIRLDTPSDAQQLPSRLVGDLGLTQRANTEPMEQLTTFIAKRKMLLVLDNFEGLVEGAGFLSQLLGTCPNLKVLVTTRERLRLEEEHVFPVQGLRYPTTLSEDARLSDAVRLFGERARQVQPHFDVKRELAGVAAVCRLVEGLPLGIELAASWTRVMPCAEIAEEIARTLDLSSTTQNVPERHRSLKAAFESSWGRLSENERNVLSKLSVFRGGFRREAASAVGDATIPVLASLVDKSLLRVLPNGRYDRHPLVYGFTHGKLLESDRSGVEAEHEACYLRLVQAQEEVARQGRQKDALRVFQEE